MMAWYKSVTPENHSEVAVTKAWSFSGMNTALKIIGSIAAAMALCLLLLVGTSCIPREMIQRNSELSAEYFGERAPFEFLLGDYVNSIQDNYSDTVLCDILYCIDNRSPFSSAIEAKYAQGSMEEAYSGYLSAVRGEKEANREYGRYWHGSMVLLRPLMMIMPISGIRTLFGLVTIVIQSLIAVVFWRRGSKGFAVCYILSFLLIHPWMLLSSLEYGTAFLTVSLASLFILKNRERDRHWTYRFFAVIGVVTCFVDFLTTETLTFTLPMLLFLIDREGRDISKRTDKVFAAGGIPGNKKRFPKVTGEKALGNQAGPDGFSEMSDTRWSFLYMVKSGLCWLMGYLSMFSLKMLLLLMVAGREVMISSLTEGLHRVSGEVRIANVDIAPSVSAGERLSGAIWHNLACLYPVKSGKMESGGVWVLTLAILVIGFSTVYLLHDRVQWRTFLPLFVLATFPYLRFLVLSNHAYEHFFITYRAQMVTVTVFMFFVYENGIKQLIKLKKRGR